MLANPSLPAYSENYQWRAARLRSCSQMLAKPSAVLSCQILRDLVRQTNFNLQTHIALGKFIAHNAFVNLVSVAKNPVRIILGKPKKKPNNTILKLLFQHFIGIRKIQSLTCGSPNDEGTGSQAILVMLGINFARRLDAAYVHSPFTQLHQADVPGGEYEKAWDQALNLGAHETHNQEAGRQPIEFCDIYENYIFRKYFTKILYEDFNFARLSFLEKSNLPKCKDYTKEISIGIHVRRGEVSSERNSFMWSDIEFQNNVINNITSILNERGLVSSVFIVSQGDKDYFARLDRPIDAFYLDAPALHSFKHLVTADILIMAKSRFSHLAALFSTGVTLFQPWRDLPNENFAVPLPMDDWIGCDPDGSFDEAAFRKQLDQLLVAKSAGRLPAMDSRPASA